MIPEAAVDAACGALVAKRHDLGADEAMADVWGNERWAEREQALSILEAAAPHMLAGASGALRDWYEERMIEEHATDVELTEYEQGREVGITEGILAASLKIGAHGND